MFNYVPFELPTTKDGEYICCLDDAGVLRSRREQLGLTQQQVAKQAGIQFSLYQRLESGERSLSGCSMRVGLSICSVLLLDPCETVGITVKQLDPESLKPQIKLDFNTPDDDTPKRAGRKQIRRDIMTVYFNHDVYSIIIPQNVLIAMGKPHEIEFLWNKNAKRILIHGIEEHHNSSFDVPELAYRGCSALTFYETGMINDAKTVLNWDDCVYAVECRVVRDKDYNQYVLCDLKTAKPSEMIKGPFTMPSYYDEED